MRNKYYLEFIKNYPDKSPIWFAGLKYIITQETDSDYYIGKKSISKLLENSTYKRECVKTSYNLPSNHERG